MEIKECYVSKNGISCFTNINTMHNIKKINFNKKYLLNLKNNLIFFISLRSIEFIITDFIKNKHFFIENIDNNYFLTSIIFN